jgi:hypothetical protein
MEPLYGDVTAETYEKTFSKRQEAANMKKRKATMPV